MNKKNNLTLDSNFELLIIEIFHIVVTKVLAC